MVGTLESSPAPTVCAVVVTYNPDLPVLMPLLEQLERSHCDYVVVDNHSGNQDALRAAVQGHTHLVRLVANDANIGQASALNLALDEVRQHQYTLALLFDQDSSIGPDFLGKLLEAWNEAVSLSAGKVAAIGPRLEEPRSGRRMPFRTFRQLLERQEAAVPTSATRLIDTAFLITSGSLISMDALAQIGLMRADYFIDNVDLEWCFRARHKGYHLYGTDHATLQHRIGEDSDNPLVRHGVIVQHSALRYYYSTRNRLHLHRQPYAPMVWRIKDGVRFLLKSLYLLITSSERKAFWSSLQRALRDARHLT